MRLGWLLVTAALAATACGASAFPTPGSAEVGAVNIHDPSARVEDLAHGRSVYLGKCGGCHLLIEPGKFASDVWPEKVERMQEEKRVHLEPGEVRDLVRYLVGASAVAHATPQST